MLRPLDAPTISTVKTHATPQATTMAEMPDDQFVPGARRTGPDGRRQRALSPGAIKAIYGGLATCAVAGCAMVRAAQPCAPDDFSCWDAQPYPIDMYARLQADLNTLAWGACPAVCTMSANEVFMVSQTASIVGAVLLVTMPPLGLAGKIAMIGVAAFGNYASQQTLEFFALAKNRCVVSGCPTEPLF